MQLTISELVKGSPMDYMPCYSEMYNGDDDIDTTNKDSNSLARMRTLLTHLEKSKSAETVESQSSSKTGKRELPPGKLFKRGPRGKGKNSFNRNNSQTIKLSTPVEQNM